MSLVVKMVDGTQKSVDVPDLDITAAELKRRMADVVGIPAEEQRVVVRGKVLKDGDVLRALGVEHGHAVHVVRAKSAAKPATTMTPAPAPTAPAPASAPASDPAPAGAANPYAGLLSGMFAPPQQAPAAAAAAASPMSAFGGMPGMGMPADMNADAAMQMMRTPGALEMLSHLANNPQFMEQMAQANPAFASMPPETRQMVLHMMRNPEALRAMLGAVGGGGGGASTTESGASGGGGSAMPGLFMPPFGGATAQPPTGNPRELYREQLAQLREMGFPNEEANIAALQQAQGNIHFAIERLFSA